MYVFDDVGQEAISQTQMLRPDAEDMGSVSGFTTSAAVDIVCFRDV